MKLKAILFDMDGTIVDSIPAWHRTFNQVRGHTGQPGITYDEFCNGVLGESTSEDVRRFFPMLSEDELVRLYDRFFPQNMEGVRLFPDSLRILDYLESKGILKGIVTNTPRNLMDLTLKTVGLEDRFDVALGGDDVSVGKPDPEIVRKACQMLGLGTDETLMVGDTEADMGAGRNAGCKTVGIKMRGDWRVESLGELTELLSRL
ncbi:MAG: HAD family hydrolase [Candidatus Altiarchaeota archaeon]